MYYITYQKQSLQNTGCEEERIVESYNGRYENVDEGCRRHREHQHVFPAIFHAQVPCWDLREEEAVKEGAQNHT